ncbi:MAG: RluA family pseudouridine synthase [Lewinellaceae bacterium]|nr:RluA family pseudouridine synthase [Saprospiraceae bacterium]MCB9329511.1 RluA family pseudouridine synthase [Lewinellaceae bacterium]
MRIELLHEDEHVLVVVKPADLLTIPDRFGNPDSLQAQLERKYGKIYIVHRLDRETSGVICFARTEAAHRNLSMQFEQHKVGKHYLALVDGVMHQETGEIDKPIGPHPVIAGKMAVSKQGKPSFTQYQVLELFKQFTLVEATLKTGRTHQIRVHFQSIGYPLAVDSLYGRREGFLLSEIKGRNYRSGKFSEEERPLMTRTSLHATRLVFEHPETGERLEFSAELPKDFNAVLNQLRKWGK